jgi:hypothetical protein
LLLLGQPPSPLQELEFIMFKSSGTFFSREKAMARTHLKREGKSMFIKTCKAIPQHTYGGAGGGDV